MPISPLLLTVALLLLVFVVCVLGVMALVRSADELVDAQWEELRQMRSDSGTEFFPTSDAPRELELAMADAVELAAA